MGDLERTINGMVTAFGEPVAYTLTGIAVVGAIMTMRRVFRRHPEK